MSAAAGRPVAVHQFIPALNPHDATGTHTLKLRDALRAAGWRSEIFAEAIHDDLASQAYKHWMYPEHAAEGDVAIYQFTTSSAVAGYLAEQGLPLILDFHDFTAPEYFAGWEPRSVQRAAAAGEELALLAPQAVLGMAKSPFSERQLRRAGCRRTVVVPVLADYGRVTGAPDPRVAAELAALGGAVVAPTSSSWGGSCRRRRSTSWSRRCGPTAGSTTHGPGCIWSVARRASSTPRRCRGSSTTSAWRPRSASPARCRTRRWPPTSLQPTSTSRSRPTRASAVPLVEAMVAGVPGGHPGRRGGRRDGGRCRPGAGRRRPRLRRGRAAPGLHGRPPAGRARRRRAPAGGRAVGGAAAATLSSTPWPGRWPDEPEGGLRHPALRDPGDGRRRDGGAPPGRGAARPHGLGVRGPHDLRARPPHLGRRAGAGDHRGERGARAPAPSARTGGFPTSTASTGSCGWHPAWRPWSRGRRWVDYNGPVSTRARRRRRRVRRRRHRLLSLPVPPDRGGHRPGPGAGGPAPGRPRRAGAVPAGVPGHLRGRRRLLLPHGVGAPARGADVPGGRAPADRARSRRGGVRAAPAGPAASWSGWGTGPTS